MTTEYFFAHVLGLLDYDDPAWTFLSIVFFL